MGAAVFCELRCVEMDKRQLEEKNGEKRFKELFQRYKQSVLKNAVNSISRAIKEMAIGNKEYVDVILYRRKFEYATDHFVWKDLVDRNEIMNYISKAFPDFEILLKDYYILEGMQRRGGCPNEYVIVVRVKDGPVIKTFLSLTKR